MDDVPLNPRERMLATKFYNARTALLREWLENGNEAAKKVYDESEPENV